MKQRGIILLVTLIVTGVISMLVLANMRSLLLATKISHLVRMKQDAQYQLMVNHQYLIDSNAWLISTCVQQSSPPFSYPISHESKGWCLWRGRHNQSFDYQVWDGGSTCCLLASKGQMAHVYHLRFRKGGTQEALTIASSVVVSELSESCHCQKVSGIAEGILNQFFIRA